MLLQKIENLLSEVSNLTAQNAKEIEELRLKYLSKKGEINALMADFRNVAAEEKKAESWNTPSADYRQERNHRHILTHGIYTCRRTGNR